MSARSIDACMDAVLNKPGGRDGALLPVLHAIQAEHGHVPADAVPMIADRLNLSRAEVHGVLSYYHHFRRQPAGKHVVQLCRAEACQARGAEALAAHATQALGIDFHQTTDDGSVTLEPVYCLGQCACGPAMMVDDMLHAQVTPERFNALLTAVTSDAVTSHGPRHTPAKVPSDGAGVIRVYVPRDSTALALGADEVAAEIVAQAAKQGVTIELVRNGSRGMFWLEPLVEVATPEGRVAYGPVTAADVPSLFASDFLSGAPHPLALGKTDGIPFLKKQERLTFARVGITDPLSIDDYLAHEGFAGLKQALAMTPEQIVQQVTDSGLRGRGGAAFPTGIKWNTVRNAPADRKYIVCNADEGDSGTFSDRMVMEDDPFMLIEGMTIAGLAVGAEQGYIYVRSEYPHAIAALQQAIDIARAHSYLGQDIRNSGQRFELEVRVGAGSYVCGEETALLESIEGKRGIVRAKPPLPAIAGLFGKPTVINNVISLATVPVILARGADFYRNYGMGRSRGTLPIQLAGNLKQGGLVEKAFGVTLREMLEDFGGGTESGRPLRAVQVGGPLGAYLPPSQFDTPLDYEAFLAIGGTLGHGGIVAFDDSVDMLQQARYAMEFCAVESCGKCTPCRIGSTRGREALDKVIATSDPDVREQQVHLVRDLCDLMLNGSLCAMGGMTPFPVLSAMNHFPEDFGIHPAATKGSIAQKAKEAA
ncbi:MAG: hypothetical protein RL404_1261 [Pseudomonadota bacterium]